jgi:hypothetical protein
MKAARQYVGIIRTAVRAVTTTSSNLNGNIKVTTPSFPLPDMCSMQTLRAATLMVMAAMFLSACTQTPIVKNEDPAVLQPKPVVVTPEVAPPTVSAMPAIPPKDATVGSIGSAGGTVAPSRGQLSAVQIAAVASVTPAGTTRYECVKGKPGAESRDAIAFPEQSGRICARFPAMGPCQYEREACRAGGGRVIRFDGAEITKDVEKEYDKQVQRFRLNAG